MKKLLGLLLGLALGWSVNRYLRTGSWPWQTPATPSAKSAPTTAVASPSAGNPSQRGSQGSTASAPLTDAGTVVEMHGILAGSRTEPHLEGAADKARRATQNLQDAQKREREALQGAP